MEYPTYLIHYGVLGQKWGIRRFQNEDGTYTNEGLERRKSNNVSLPKGTIMYRSMSGTKPYAYKNYAYVNVTDKLSEHMTDVGEGFEGFHDHYAKLESKKNLKIAGLEEGFQAIMKANKLDYSTYLKNVPKDIENKGEYVLLNLKDILSEPINIIDGWGGNNTYINNAIKYLKKKGYNGMIDPVDGPSQIKNNGKAMATMIFNPHKNLKVKGIQSYY